MRSTYVCVCVCAPARRGLVRSTYMRVGVCVSAYVYTTYAARLLRVCVQSALQSVDRAQRRNLYNEFAGHHLRQHVLVSHEW